MSFWNLYTGQNKVPVYITNDLSLKRASRKNSDTTGISYEPKQEVIHVLI